MIEAPVSYFTTLVGTNLHWQTQGTHIVYFPTVHGFRIYISRPELSFRYRKLTVQEPIQDLWSVNYVAVQSPESYNHDARCNFMSELIDDMVFPFA
mgnify:CR=1 FL=1